MKLALVVGLALAMGTVVELQHNTAHAQRGGGRGGGRSGGGGSGQVGGGSGGARGGGSGHVGGGGSRSGGGGVRPGISGFRGSAIHAPALRGPRNAGGGERVGGGGAVRNNGGRVVRNEGGGGGAVRNNGGGGAAIRGNSGDRVTRDSAGRVGAGGVGSPGRIYSPNRTPSLSHPNPGSIRSQITRNPIFNNRGNGPGRVDNSRGRVTGNNRINPGNFGVNGRNNARIGGPANIIRRSGIASRAYNGNSINWRNRQFNLGNQSYRPSYYRHSNYYHGHWNGNRNLGFGSALAYGLGSSLGNGWGAGNGGYGYERGFGYGGRNGRYGRYGYRPLGWGLGGCGLGSIAYNSGYLGYSNPYYATGGWSGYNYSQPIQVSYVTPVTVVEESTAAQPESNSSDTVLDAAVAAFQRQDYEAALDITNKGITQTPDDAALHEFRALVLFAKQDYQQAASTIHSVLAVGPGWDWTTMSGIYGDVNVYTTQLRSLEAFTKSHPEDAASLFLLAYHYLSCGHTEAATQRLQQVVTRMPKDKVAADILLMLQPPTSEDVQETENPASASTDTEQSQVQAVDPKMLTGNWKATRPDGSEFTLNMTDDSKFSWTFALQGEPTQKFAGTYSIDGNILALERDEGGSLIAEVTPDGSGKFNFRMLGAPEEDKGLDFTQ
jgi:tetratricopeptide (TPR) repeat protein